MLQEAKNKQNSSVKFSQIAFEKKWLGSVDFQTSLDEQEKLKLISPQKSKIYFLGFESQTPTISQGLRATPQDILWSEQELKQASLKTLKVRRGGETTLHAPGQLIIYPIVFLPLLKMRIRDFLEALEMITQSFFKDLNIVAEKIDPYAGLSTAQGKIAFFGIHISKGVSHHGLSINVYNDLNLFSSIKSCGKAYRQHDKLCLYHPTLTLKELFDKWTDKAEDFLKNKQDPKGFGI